MSYSIIKWKKAADGYGWEMDAPEDLDCIHLADFQGSKWALYKINNTIVENENIPKFEYNVEEKLCYLFDSGQWYPPARALAREEIQKRFFGKKTSCEEFVMTYAEALRRYLEKQKNSGYILAEAIKDEIGYLCQGEWHWMLKAHEDDTVSWVSDDYFIYRNPISFFNLSAEMIEQLSKNEC